ncbi:gluzincin family metallopeptidase [Flavobacterium ichthyis]|uniref:aminopeptidase n=1 Tax=Flavobacterium ichthyis TaxID=2698827 RepID=UPI001F40ECE0|nr:aminopeptidase [Flavobacterium ichthyis]
MKIFPTLLLTFLVITFFEVNAQHRSEIVVHIGDDQKSATVWQKLLYHNQSQDTLTSVVLNDWNHAYSSRETPLARRFSDEFVRSFYLANESERGKTDSIAFFSDKNIPLNWHRFNKHLDVIEVNLLEKLAPNHSTEIIFIYKIIFPKDRFTKYGWNDKGELTLKNWFLHPARFENHQFVIYSNQNLDDIPNAVANFQVTVNFPEKLWLTSDLNITADKIENNQKTIVLQGKNRVDFSLSIENKNSFLSYKNEVVKVETNLKDDKLDDIQKALIIDRVTKYVDEHIGKYPFEKIIVSQTDYDRNPFYGLNQLPAFLAPFPDQFLFELKFLKTYLNNFLKSSLKMNQRYDNWVYDAIQIYTMINYIDELYPNSKMMGNISQWKLLKGYNLTTIDFNQQYNYFYMLMARKNLDQALGEPKNTLIKFNEQIASKYRAGLSLKYLDNYLDDNTVEKSIQDFYKENLDHSTTRHNFEYFLKFYAPKNIDWFFSKLIDSREIVDYKFKNVKKTNDSIIFTLRNKTGTKVPVPIFTTKNGEILSKFWIENVSKDSTFTISRNGADKIVINQNNEVPEFNLRNNWKSLKGFLAQNRPIKFNFMKDLEDPYYNQILYVPTIGYNFYDGLTPGMRFHNKTILEKPFIFDVNPMFSTKTKTLSGSASFAVNQYNRNSNLFHIRYHASASYFHYAPDATYTKINPSVTLRFRPSDFRDNRKQAIQFRQVLVHREKSIFQTENLENYTVFNAKYVNTRTEITNHLNFVSDFQIANKFSKISVETEVRKLFDDNRQLTIRAFAGAFLYNNTNSDFFSFALDRPTDYLFDYNYYGRSESTGIFSQQLILAEGGFKSKLPYQFANQWITTVNSGYSIWNWVEAYADFGLVKQTQNNPKFVYDNGIRLNLLPDYFELYFPVYSNNGWEIAQPNYHQKIRFIVTLSPSTLVNLFTRKWF